MPKIDENGNVIKTPRDTAKTNIENIPGWATWTGNEAVTWIDTNVIDLASAKVALEKMARMIVELRNALYPDLESG